MEKIMDKELSIDLSSAKTIGQLAGELNSILETKTTPDNVINLNLGDLSLKQSQLLSIKALIESMGCTVSYILTTSEMTEASAVSLSIPTHKPAVNTDTPAFHDTISEHLEDLNETFSTVNTSETVLETVKKEIEEDTSETQEETEEIETAKEESNVSEDDNIKSSSENSLLENDSIKNALDEVLGINKTTIETSIEQNIIKPDIKIVKPQIEESNFEGTETTEISSEGKYVLLDTDGITEDNEEKEEDTAALPTLYLSQTLRSGQTVTYEGNIFIIGDTHPGSEVIAKGDVTVWGIIGGIVHAGSEGNIKARVRALKLNPIQLRIAGLYSRRNDTVNVPFVQKTNEFTPEEARIHNKRIVVYKTLRRED